MQLAQQSVRALQARLWHPRAAGRRLGCDAVWHRDQHRVMLGAAAAVGQQHRLPGLLVEHPEDPGLSVGKRLATGHRRGLPVAGDGGEPVQDQVDLAAGVADVDLGTA